MVQLTEVVMVLKWFKESSSDAPPTSPMIERERVNVTYIKFISIEKETTFLRLRGEVFTFRNWED
jgi:hypothetical protein